MYVYIHMYSMYINIYTYTYIYIHKHKYIYIYIHTYMDIRRCHCRRSLCPRSLVFAEGLAGLLGCRRMCHSLARCIGCGVHTSLVILAALRVISLAGFAFLSLHASGIIAILALHARLAIRRQRVARHLLHILSAEAFFAVNAGFDARSSCRRREIKRRQANRERARERERACARSIACAFFNALATLSRAQHPI